MIYPKGSYKWDDLSEWVRNDATSDEGMTKWFTVYFHLYNLNGVSNKLPDEIDYYSFIDENNEKRFAYGLFHITSKSENHHYKKLIKAFSNRCNNFSWWDVNYHVSEMKKDVKESWERIANSQFDLDGKKTAQAKLTEINKKEVTS